MPQGAVCLVLPAFPGASVTSALLSSDDITALEQLRSEGVIAGNAEQSYYLAARNGSYRGVLVLGCGDADSLSPETVRRGIGAAVSSLRQNRIATIVADATGLSADAAVALVEGLVLGQYQYTAYKSDPKPAVAVSELTLVTDAESTEALQARCDAAAHMCGNANWARDLAHMPSNDLTPSEMAECAKAIAKETGARCEVLYEDEMHKLGMNALLAVARGSAERATLSILRYEHPDAKKTVAMVGKGVTFDTGGISIKAFLNMHEMKYDMCGAAAVLGAMKTVCESKPPINVIAAIPAVENTLGPDAVTPGEIVRAYNGTTIEIKNTDAEGRLILADALAYVIDKDKPDAIVDAATLTGASIVAMGHVGSPVLGTDEGLIRALRVAGDSVGERIWPFPLWDDYAKLMEGVHGDLHNIETPKQAGTITAACFLRKFVGDTPWAHLDIAGTAWGMANVGHIDPNGATGFGVRLLSEWVRREAHV
jgi:leucyl aminopeptidase